MFNLFGLRKDSKKSSSEKEVDGGFVIVGEKQNQSNHNNISINVTFYHLEMLFIHGKPYLSVFPHV